MAATKLQFNWAPVTFTPAGGSLITFTKVTSVAFDKGGSLLGFSGDGDRYNTVLIADFADPGCSVTAGDIASLMSPVLGVAGVLSATHLDAKNGAGSGAMVYQLNNAVPKNVSPGGSHRQYGTATLEFDSYSSDGSTSPLGVTITP